MKSENSPKEAPRKVLIIGGGFVGLECARRLANDERFEVSLVDRNNHHLFQPLLYQVATASLAAPDIARSLRQILEKARNVTVLMDEIADLSPGERTATGKSGHVYSYDYLVLATGVRTSFFGNLGWEQHTLGLKTLAEAQMIRRTVLSNLEKAELSTDPDERRRLMTVAIVGGGPTGVELAGAFADLLRRSLHTNFRRIDTTKLRVILIEGSERILGAYDEEQSEYAEKRLSHLGVEVRTSTTVSNVSAQCVHLGNGETIDTAAIVWAAGTEASPLAAKLDVPPADRAGRIAPEPDLSLPGHPEIFAGGDVVSIRDGKGNPVPGVAPAAMQMGRHIAKVLKIDADRYTDEARPAFKYYDKGIMAIIGKNAAVVKSGNLRLRAFPAWLAWLFVHVLFLIGFRNKLSVLLGWAFAYLRDTPDTRIIVNSADNEQEAAAQAGESYPDAA
jgi:NADH dehydrogenase